MSLEEAQGFANEEPQGLTMLSLGSELPTRSSLQLSAVAMVDPTVALLLGACSAWLGWWWQGAGPGTCLSGERIRIMSVGD